MLFLPFLLAASFGVSICRFGDKIWFGLAAQVLAGGSNKKSADSKNFRRAICLVRVLPLFPINKTSGARPPAMVNYAILLRRTGLNYLRMTRGFRPMP